MHHCASIRFSTGFIFDDMVKEFLKMHSLDMMKKHLPKKKKKLFIVYSSKGQKKKKKHQYRGMPKSGKLLSQLLNPLFLSVIWMIVGGQEMLGDQTSPSRKGSL